MKNIILNILFIAFAPFIFAGVINRVKAVWAGRRGPPIIQPLYDFIRLLRKGEVISNTSSGVFYWTPVISLCAVLASSMLVPMAGGRSMAGFEGDFILFAYLMALSKFMSLAGAMDTGSSFEGMGASREAAFSSLVEPAFFIIMGAAAALSGSASFAGIKAMVGSNSGGGIMAASLAAAALLIMAVTEGCRVPVDDPNTHLELTMIHEVMVLDNSGPGLALISYSANLKMFLICSLLANFLMPSSLAPAASAAVFSGIILLTAALIGCAESLMARLRMTHVPQFVFFMASLAGAALSVIVIFMQGVIK